MTPETLDQAAQACVWLIDAAASIRKDTITVVASNDHIEVIKHYDKLRKIVDQIDEAQKALEDMKQRLSREQVPDVMRAHNVKTITIEGVGRVSLSNRWSCSMVDKGLGMSWLRNNGHGGLIQETVNSGTLAAFAKSLNDEEGKELPAEIFKTGTMTVTSITKA